jgi:hypothetical protein
VAPTRTKDQRRDRLAGLCKGGLESDSIRVRRRQLDQQFMNSITSTM